ncbi:beta-alanine--pyruvate transaminase [Paracidovorax wautersii]|uniref:Beta-alanine--pyruvate transaminase n=1 Tax=Paracidovorax wautersii TaxID=1177982 RepID=A0ABU1I9B1_9BURK|nr:beta-alanine--pyruvate transaminase [Paracidovorax wautersii]
MSFVPLDTPSSATEASRLDAAWLDAHWMPFTANRQFKAQPRMIVSGQGAYYTDVDGRKIFDGLSGLWCSGLGHGRKEVAEAIGKAAATLDYSPAFQFGHPASFALANKIKELTPQGLDYVFFTGSGSESADTSLKIARAYWRTKGLGQKTRLIGREKGYHGVNFGGISVGGIVGNRKTFGQGIEADHLPHTQPPAGTFQRGMADDGGRALADKLLDVIALHDASNIAAVIVEPFSGSAGVVIPPKGYLERIREICTQNNILLIFDEVITGFGRCGAWTGSEAFGVTPDILNFAKQVTNGAQPLGGIVATKEIYDTFMAAGGPEYMLEFTHGYTYSAHPRGLRGRQCRAGHPAEGRHARPRQGAGAQLRERRARPEGRQACRRHPQLRPGRRLHHRGAAGRAGPPAVRDRHEVLGQGLLRALRRRHHPAGAPVHQHRGRDRPPGERAGRRPGRNRLNS